MSTIGFYRDEEGRTRPISTRTRQRVKIPRPKKARAVSLCSACGKNKVTTPLLERKKLCSKCAREQETLWRIPNLPDSPEALELLYTRTGYRTESAYGEGYRDAIPVIEHEIEELGNDSEQPEIAERLGLPKDSSLKQIGDEIDRRFGKDAKVLWLTTKEGVKYYLSTNEDDDVDARMTPEQIEVAVDKYQVPKNALMIIDLGSDGQLFLMNAKDYETMEGGGAARQDGSGLTDDMKDYLRYSEGMIKDHQDAMTFEQWTRAKEFR